MLFDVQFNMSSFRTLKQISEELGRICTTIHRA
jgi:hypothetical protein